MKIVHTADWHIGKILYKQSLQDDIQLFFQWLLEYLRQEQIDVLLVAGDIFDLANPSNADIKMYYDFLVQVSLTGTRMIITGGNHDSVSMLNAPADLLKVINIHITGGVPDHPQDEIIPVLDKKGALECIVLAVPFLRDKDLRVSIQADESIDKLKIIPKAVQKHYDDLVAMAISLYGTQMPIIAMGHLYMRGAITSESEREIHVGNLQGLDSDIIHPDISYMALGHIHKPQLVGNKSHIRYSGSPVYLDFSEAGYEKTVVQIELDNGRLQEIRPVKVPLFRLLLRIQGNLEFVRQKLETYNNTNSLLTFADVEVIEPAFDAFKIVGLESLTTQASEHYKIIKSRISFDQNKELLSSSLDIDKTIEEFSPIEVLDKRLETENLEDDIREKIKSAYIDVLQSFND